MVEEESFLGLAGQQLSSRFSESFFLQGVSHRVTEQETPSSSSLHMHIHRHMYLHTTYTCVLQYYSHTFIQNVCLSNFEGCVWEVSCRLHWMELQHSCGGQCSSGPLSSPEFWGYSCKSPCLVYLVLHLELCSCYTSTFTIVLHPQLITCFLKMF